MYPFAPSIPRFRALISESLLPGSAAPHLLTDRRRYVEPSEPPQAALTPASALQPQRSYLRVVRAFISARAQIGNVIRQPTHVQPRELLDGRLFLDFVSTRIYLPCTWILKIVNVGHRGGTGPDRPRFAGRYLSRRILSILLHSCAKATKQQHFRYSVRVQRLMTTF